MYAAQLFNQQENSAVPYIYGSVTNGYDWAFLQLKENQLYIDTDRYTILKISELLGVFQVVVDAF
ncbi:MAG: hypothetical protein HC880_16825 [Bacteroidia bacterium]|nr:hypothetical protein [Bacteroidia bacterium]